MVLPLKSKDRASGRRNTDAFAGVVSLKYFTDVNLFSNCTSSSISSNKVLLLYQRGLPNRKKITSDVRETGVSRRNGGPIRGLLKLLNTEVQRWSGGFRGPSISPHDAERLFDSLGLLDEINACWSMFCVDIQFWWCWRFVRSYVTVPTTHMERGISDQIQRSMERQGSLNRFTL